jgi:DeoR/GlpR family transcriptional regulator of sugar metabolism
MVNASSEVIVVSDSDKIGVIGLVTIMPLTETDKLVTDSDAPQDFVEELRGQGVQVILV